MLLNEGEEKEMEFTDDMYKSYNLNEDMYQEDQDSDLDSDDDLEHDYGSGSGFSSEED